MKRVLFTLLFISISVFAQEMKPLYELGIGGAYANFPDYPGASHNRTLVLPFPSVILRGDILRAEKDEGVRGLFWKTERFEFDLSFDGTLPSDGGDNEAREGMPKLDTVIEFGPKLITHLYRKRNNGKIDFDLHLASRYVFSSDLENWNDRGLTFNPFLSLTIEDYLKGEALFILTAGAKYASNKWGAYYYEVAPEFATPMRPTYKANGGFAEASVAFGMYYPTLSDIWFFTGIIKSYYNKSKNLESPLLTKKNTTSVAVGFYWNFHKAPWLVYDD